METTSTSPGLEVLNRAIDGEEWQRRITVEAIDTHERGLIQAREHLARHDEALAELRRLRDLAQ
jgi:1,2-phenylacetyl-CoA epoxidase PaaB subunit